MIDFNKYLNHGFIKKQNPDFKQIEKQMEMNQSSLDVNRRFT